MSRTSGRRSGVDASPEPAVALASSPRSSSRTRTDSPARRQSSSNKKNANAAEPSASKRTASPAGPARRRATERAESGAQRAASPAYIADSLLAKDKVTPLRTPSTPYGNPQGTPYTPFTPMTPGGDHPLSLMRHAADAGKLHLGFHNDQYIEDISVEWMYRPHTITALAIIVGVLCFLAFSSESSGDWLENTRWGVGVAAFFFIVLGMLIFPSGPFIRPHPVVWRVAFGIGVLYELYLIILLFQTKHHARQSLQFFDRSLGVPVTERNYADNCDLTVANVMGNVDIFVVSHFVGWIIKALIIRDALICWVISIQWELIEMLFKHMLPNFAECWWDQWILDVLLSNALGIFIGCRLAKYLEMKEYRWGSYGSIPSYLGKAKRTLMQFTPASWTKVEWKPTSSLKRIVAVQLLILSLHAEELNAFMLKFILWVPPESKLNVVRLFIWAFVGVPSLRQIYSYLSDPRCKRIGHQTFLCLIILFTEFMVIFKFGKGEFPKPMPHNVQVGLAVFSGIYALGLAFVALRAPGDSNAAPGASPNPAQAIKTQ